MLDAQPASFANGRYTVNRFLGEGGKKKVFLAHDNTLDRDVAYALIKTEGLDDISRQRIPVRRRPWDASATIPISSPSSTSVSSPHPTPLPSRERGGRRTGEGSGQPYMVLPLMSGGDVEGLIEKARTLRPKGEKVAEGRMREK